MPAGEKAAYLDKYKSEMKEVVKTFDDLETAVKAGKSDDAKKIFEKLADEKEKGHKDFNPDGASKPLSHSHLRLTHSPGEDSPGLCC